MNQIPFGMTSIDGELYVSDWEAGLVHIDDVTESSLRLHTDDVIHQQLITAASLPSGLHYTPVSMDASNHLSITCTAYIVPDIIMFNCIEDCSYVSRSSTRVSYRTLQTTTMHVMVQTASFACPLLLVKLPVRATRTVTRLEQTHVKVSSL